MTNTHANITPEQADEMLAAETASVANDNEAARDPLPPVEEAVAPAPEAVMPPPHAELPKPPQAVGEAMPIHEAKIENLIVVPAVLTNAEKHLAAHIGAEIDPMLEKNLVLNVSSALDKGATNLVLSFEGDMVAANPAVLGEQVIAALHKLPAMQALFAEHHHTPTSEFHDGKLQVVVPHLTTAKYAHLIQALATNVEAAHEAPKEVAALPAGHQCDASCTHAPAAEAPATTVEGPAQQQATIAPALLKGIAG